MNEKSRKAVDFIYYHANALLIAAGIAVIIFTTELLSALHYIIGGALLFYAVCVFIYSFLRLKNTINFTANLSAALITFLAGLMVLLTAENALLIIGTAWGLFGLYKGGTELSQTLENIRRHEFFLLNLAQATLTVAFAALLLYDPLHHIEFHMYVLGLEIIFSSMKAYKAKSSVVEKLRLDKASPQQHDDESEIYYPYSIKNGN